MKILVDVASTPEREELVSEIFIDDLQWCELSQDGGRFMLTFLPRPDSVPIQLEFDVAVALLQHMKDFLKDGSASRDKPEWHIWQD
jgi:hypothetical protein